MKSRFHKSINFLAFNLLFFALYLNFVQGNSSEYQENLNYQATKSPEKAQHSADLTVQREKSVSVPSMVVLP